MFRVINHTTGQFEAEFGRYEWAREHILETGIVGMIHNTESGRISLPIQS